MPWASTHSSPGRTPDPSVVGGETARDAGPASRASSPSASDDITRGDSPASTASSGREAFKPATNRSASGDRPPASSAGALGVAGRLEAAFPVGTAGTGGVADAVGAAEAVGTAGRRITSDSGSGAGSTAALPAAKALVFDGDGADGGSDSGVGGDEDGGFAGVGEAGWGGSGRSASTISRLMRLPDWGPCQPCP